AWRIRRQPIGVSGEPACDSRTSNSRNTPASRLTSPVFDDIDRLLRASDTELSRFGARPLNFVFRVVDVLGRRKVVKCGGQEVRTERIIGGGWRFLSRKHSRLRSQC